LRKSAGLWFPCAAVRRVHRAVNGRAESSLRETFSPFLLLSRLYTANWLNCANLIRAIYHPLTDFNAFSMATHTLTTAELKTWLITQNQTAGTLAKKLNLPAWTVRRWELGKRPIPKWLAPVLDSFAERSPAKPARACRYRDCQRPLTGRKNKEFCSGKCRTREYLERKGKGAV